MSEGTPSTYSTQRRAAARNRIAIIEAAHDLFADNPLVPLSEVAKRAGVGAGTLYRHFPTREDLILAAYQHDIERLTVTVDEVLARHTSAQAAFVEWFEMLAAYIRIKHGLGDALHSAAAQDVISASWAPTSAAVAKLVDACVAEGTIAPGHDPADIIMLMSFLWRVANNEDGVAQGRRLIAAVFSGLKHAPQSI
ncbi:TetR family transcriptional regulator [Mycolicibacterium canariasense]|uniref:TetR family transcriptional regulator n=1 Tax=Mycolicibacterium canariasense TaxID=228230 RepID=A0A100W841_MYCCR|nr:TetR/AcrR family transcriptional regulator [Mycolicibacterium canariasense]MCV7212082.1 TetR/AcrR family transcriptional regulator [Mycolicibacterium canariasense]ORV04168.1 TetR family transcriptional regulator [Mycolicibacterium canariasense]GAS93402.1 TetR family transcriptional regulator [Mycolicibacterium canariasense]